MRDWNVMLFVLFSSLICIINNNISRSLSTTGSIIASVEAFNIITLSSLSSSHRRVLTLCPKTRIIKSPTTTLYVSSSENTSNDKNKNNYNNNNQQWQGDVVPGGQIRGCTLQQVDGSETEWIISIDGIEADLGRFSDAIYKKITKDAKSQQFQGFRPGTIPPHLEPTYRAFTMDECARETVLEAMVQNNIRPFESSRSDIFLYNFDIPPPPTKKGTKKKKSSSKQRKSGDTSNEVTKPSEDDNNNNNTTPGWLQFETMKEAIDAGWKPGQSFSFQAKNCKGQKVVDNSKVTGAQPLGVTY